MSNIRNTLPVRLGQSAPVANTTTVLYTAVDLSVSPIFSNITMSTSKIRVLSLYALNRDPQSSTDSVSIWIVPSGETPGDNNVLVNNYVLNNSEELLKSEIILHPGDSIQVRSSKGLSTFHSYGEIEYIALEEFEIRANMVELQKKVVDGTASAGDKEKLVLLLGGAIQTNNNSNICGG